MTPQETYHRELIRILEHFDSNKSADMEKYIEEIEKVSRDYFKDVLAKEIREVVLKRVQNLLK